MSKSQLADLFALDVQVAVEEIAVSATRQTETGTAPNE
jgi:hypothetical protein